MLLTTPRRISVSPKNSIHNRLECVILEVVDAEGLPLPTIITKQKTQRSHIVPCTFPSRDHESSWHE